MKLNILASKITSLYNVYIMNSHFFGNIIPFTKEGIELDNAFLK